MKLALALAVLLAACAPAAPQPKTTLEIAYADDPSRHALLWAITSGKVTSPTVDVKVSFLPLAQIIPAAGTKQYDALEASPLAVPRAPGAEPGFLILSNGLVNISSTALMTGKDGVASPAQLKGKTIGVASLGGTFVLETRYVLQKAHGLNTDLRTGEVRFSETPVEATATLLKDNRLDAAVLAQLAYYRLRSSPDHKLLANVTEEFTRLSGHRPVNSVIVTYRDKAAAKKDALAELQKMLAASRSYLLANKAEVFKDVAAKRSVEQAFLEWIFTVLDLAAGPVSDQDMAQIAATWEAAKSIGDIPSAPAVKDVVFR